MTVSGAGATWPSFEPRSLPFGPRIHSSTGLGLRGVLDSLLALGSIRWRLSVGGRRRAPRGRRMPSRRPARSIAQPVGVLRAIGPFQVRGAVRWGSERKVLLGQDSTLDRPVWILLRPRGSSPPSPVRRGLDRPGRPRWLKGGDQAEGRWDAYVAPLGCSLAELAGPEGLPCATCGRSCSTSPRNWPRPAPMGPSPRSLAVDEVWIQPDGSAQLVDVLVPSPATATDQAPQRTDQERALDLLFQAAALALEGGRRRRHDDRAPIRAAIPEHVARSLDRLNGLGPPYADVETFLDVLRADEDRPTEVNASRRVAHLGVQAVAVAPGLATMFLAAGRPRSRVRSISRSSSRGLSSGWSGPP